MGTLPSKFGHAGLELFTMYAMEKRTDKQMDGQTKNAYCPLHYGWGHNNASLQPEDNILNC